MAARMPGVVGEDQDVVETRDQTRPSNPSRPSLSVVVDVDESLDAREAVSCAPGRDDGVRENIQEPGGLLDDGHVNRAVAASPPSGQDGKSRVLERVKIVFGAEVAEELKRRWPSLMSDLKGRHDCVLAAVVKCEIDWFLPNEPPMSMRSQARPSSPTANIAFCTLEDVFLPHILIIF